MTAIARAEPVHDDATTGAGNRADRIEGPLRGCAGSTLTERSGPGRMSGSRWTGSGCAQRRFLQTTCPAARGRRQPRTCLRGLLRPFRYPRSSPDGCGFPCGEPVDRRSDRRRCRCLWRYQGPAQGGGRHGRGWSRVPWTVTAERRAVRACGATQKARLRCARAAGPGATNRVLAHTGSRIGEVWPLRRAGPRSVG